jgi:hypothetical protein
MSLVVKLIIFGWIATFATIGCCALHESGKLLKIGKRIASWLESSGAAAADTSDEGLQSPEGDAAA